MARYWAVCSGYLGRLATRQRTCTRLEQKQYSDRLLATWPAFRFAIHRENQVDGFILTVDNSVARFHGGP